MVVKSVRGRRRYVLFSVSHTAKDTFIRKLNSVCRSGESVYVIQCESGKAIIRCSPEEIARSTELVMLADPSSHSILTSGTLKTLRDKYPELRDARHPKK